MNPEEPVLPDSDVPGESPISPVEEPPTVDPETYVVEASASQVSQRR